MTSNSQLRPYKILPVTSNYVDGITFSPDGKLLASYHKRSSEFLKLWDVATGELLYSESYSQSQEWIRKYQEAQLRESNEYLDHFSFCESFSFTPDGKSLTCKGFIWDLKESQVINKRLLLGINGLYGSYGIYLSGAVSPDMQIAFGCGDYEGFGTMMLKLWKTSTNKEIYSYVLGTDRRLTDNIYKNLFSPDGRVFASLMWFRDSGDFMDGGEGEERIKIWEVKTGMQLCNIALPRVDAYSKYKGTLAFSHDGRILASNCGDTHRKVILLSDVATGKELFKISTQSQHSIDSLAFSPDNQMLASGDRYGYVILWELITQSKGLEIREIQTFMGSLSNDAIRSLAFSPDGKILAVGAGDHNGGITFWNINNGCKQTTSFGHPVLPNTISSQYFVENGRFNHHKVSVSPDGRMIANLDYDGNTSLIKFRDSQSGALIDSLKYYSDLINYTNSPKYRFIEGKNLGYNLFKRIIYCLLPDLIDKSNWRKRLFIDIYKIIFSQDGKYLIGIYFEGYERTNPIVVMIWDVVTGKNIKIKIFGYTDKIEQNSMVDYIKIVNQYPGLLAIYEHKNLRMRVIDTLTNETIFKLTDDNQILNSDGPNLHDVWQIICSPNRKFIATRYNNHEGFSVFSIWAISTGRLISRFESNDKTEGFYYGTSESDQNPALFSPNGEILAVATYSKITLWDVISGNKISTISRYIEGQMCMAFSPDGQTLAFNFGNINYCSVKFWNLENKIEFYEVDYLYRGIESLSFSADGKLLVIVIGDGRIEVLHRNAEVETELVQLETNARDLLFQELEEYLQNREWKKANDQTRKIIINIGDKDKKGYLTIHDLEDFPCEQLQRIDDLWVNNSDGRFGFTVQKQIWLDCGGKIGEYEGEVGNGPYTKFCEQIGSSDVETDRGDIWNSNEPIPMGHLPTSPCSDRTINYRPTIHLLAQKLENCGL